ncbi:hypothetical protein CR159_21190 [Pollutimonas subterranea]|uniref:GmrSD restriction endonucleases N-terminal domain-containing protein n=1 Tax=Pollutimonas subterranea TaxID=2045210 RepID=A0A2N4TYN7_9BURK|nr:DUF262 domain-containing protein [Pollutimonas subterranea]PLC47877.1 hypothetical protein CR159_21190 [Pollutimonas subterranea]
MSYVPKTIGEVILEHINRTTFLPAMQREYVWDTDGIEKLFDSIMGNYPISSFLFWKVREEKKNLWTAYKFFSDFNKEAPHNEEANFAGINQDIYLVLDGQQRLTSLFIGLKGSYRYFYYSWKKTRLYLNLFKEPKRSDNPEELTYEFAFRENDQPSQKDSRPQYWYLVGDILNFSSASAARSDIRTKLSGTDSQLIENAVVLIEELHSRLFTEKLINYYEERSDDSDKVVEVFIRANTGGKRLEYSDILLSTATAKWRTLNARDEIHDFTDDVNDIGSGYNLGKDFVLKGALYLTDSLPIQYRVKNFTRPNLEKIENNWDSIKSNLRDTVRLISRFGFGDKNLISTLALLPIAFYLKKADKKNLVDSTQKDDVRNQLVIQKWLAIALLKNAFGGSSDTTLKNLQDVLNAQSDFSVFPYAAINEKLGIESGFTDAEINNLLTTAYGSRYSYLILSLLYPDRDWRDNIYHEDHIFPKSSFALKGLKAQGISEEQIVNYQRYFNTVINLQLLTANENLEKNATPFNEWLPTRDTNFRRRHSLPDMDCYGFDKFMDFVEKRRILIAEKLKQIAM